MFNPWYVLWLDLLAYHFEYYYRISSFYESNDHIMPTNKVNVAHSDLVNKKPCS